MHNNTETRWHFWQHVTDNVETTWHFRRHVADNVETTWNFWWYWSRWDDIKKYRPKMAEIGETTLRNRPFFLKCCSFWLKSRDMLSILSEMLSCQDDMTCRRATWHVVERQVMLSGDKSCHPKMSLDDIFGRHVVRDEKTSETRQNVQKMTTRCPDDNVMRIVAHVCTH